MKNFFSILLVIFFTSFGLTAQTAINKAAEKTCDCLNKQPVPETLNQEEFTLMITKCLTQPMMDDLDNLLKAVGEKEISEGAGEKIGVQIAGKLLSICPKFTELTMKMSEDQKKTETVVSNDATDFTVGSFTKIEQDGFNYIYLKTSEGKTESFLWMKYFKGSDKFEGDTTALVGKKIKVLWKETEVYLPKAKGYYKLKEIVEIVLVD